MADSPHQPGRPSPPAVELVLRQLVDQAPYAMVLTRGSEVLHFNRAAQSALGYRPAELPTMEAAFERFYPDESYRAQVVERWTEQLGPDPVPELVVEVQHASGGLRAIAFAPPIRLANDLLLVSFFDVEQRESDRRRLAHREGILRALAGSARDFVVYRIRVDEERPHAGIVEFVTESIREVMGLTEPERFETWFERIHPDDLERVAAANSRSASTGEKFDEEMRIFHPGLDAWRQIHAISDAVLNDAGQVTHFTGTIIDVTDKRRLEEEREELRERLRRARELEALATLAGGVAHDFNNLLMGVQAAISLAMEEAREMPPVLSLLQEMESQVDRGSELTAQLLGYARRSSVEAVAANLNRLVSDTCRGFERTRPTLRVESQLSMDAVNVRVDAGQIERVILNLLVNAADASEPGQVVRLKTGVAADPPPVLEAGLPRGLYAWFEVEDEGEGIDAPLLSRIFEPFFTTKERSQGTGLGLAAADGIVRSHEGMIDVQSTVGEGSRFRVYLPALPEKAAAVNTTSRRPRAGVVLAVDDDPAVLRVLQRMLERLGHAVLTARSAEEAIEVFEANRAEVGLAIIDLVLPGTSGEDLARRLRGIDPALRVAYATGQPFSGGLAESASVIVKPFTLSELAVRVEQALAPDD